MKNVYTTSDLLWIGHLRNLLVNEGIRCEVRTPFLAAATGDLPITECWSQLWILDDAELDEALEVIHAAVNRRGQPSALWSCSGCGEEIESQFEVCWQCGSPRPEPR